jgi:peroxiredoxin Q/BCP
VLYGRRHIGVIRSTFLIDPHGILVAEWRGIRVPGHVDSVLERLSQR